MNDGPPLQWMVCVRYRGAAEDVGDGAGVTEALSDLRVLAAELGRLHGWVVIVLAEQWH